MRRLPLEGTGAEGMGLLPDYKTVQVGMSPSCLSLKLTVRKLWHETPLRILYRQTISVEKSVKHR